MDTNGISLFVDLSNYILLGNCDGVSEPEYDFNRLPISDFDPSDFLSKLRGIATGKPGENVLELTGLRSCVSAFNLARGGRKFDCLYYGFTIEGMEDKSRRGIHKGSIMHRCEKGGKRKVNTTDEYPIYSKNEVLSDKNKYGKETTLSRKRKKSRYLSYPYIDPY